MLSRAYPDTVVLAVVFYDRHLVARDTTNPMFPSENELGQSNYIDCYRVGLPPLSTAINIIALTNITMLRLSVGQVAITYISGSIQYENLAQL